VLPSKQQLLVKYSQKMDRFFLNFCTSFGLGYISKFPGTLASFTILIPLWFIIEKYYFFVIFTLICFSILSYFILEKVLVKLDNKDPSYIIIDEYIGQTIAILFCNQNITEFILAFILFRFFDINKPFPINYFDAKKNAFGLIMDDFLAGFFSGFIIIFLKWILNLN